MNDLNPLPGAPAGSGTDAEAAGRAQAAQAAQAVPTIEERLEAAFTGVLAAITTHKTAVGQSGEAAVAVEKAEARMTDLRASAESMAARAEDTRGNLRASLRSVSDVATQISAEL